MVFKQTVISFWVQFPTNPSIFMNDKVTTIDEECELCHDFFSIYDVVITENNQILCKTCYWPTAEPSARHGVSYAQ